MVQADFTLVLVSLVTTSLLLPLTLPLVLAFLGGISEATGGMRVELPVASMMLNLLVMMVLPFIAAQVLRHRCAGLTHKVLNRRQGIFLFLTALGNLAIFALYSPVILQTPEYVFMAFVSACLACLLNYALVAGCTFRLPPDKQLAFVISCASVNGIAVLIIALDFFGVTEALTTAMSAGPLYLGIPLFRLLGRLRGHDPQ